MSKFGLKPKSKKEMINQLNEIWDYQHSQQKSQYDQLSEYLQKSSYNMTQYSASAIREVQKTQKTSNIEKNKELFDKITAIIQDPKNAKFYNNILLYNV